MLAVKIRKMTEADWSQVAVIYNQGILSHKATFAQMVPAYQVWDAEHFRHTRLVAEMADGQIVGWVAIAPSFSREVYCGVAEVSIYVHNVYQHHGIGRKLLEAAAEESVRNGIWTLEALIFDDNASSLKLFRKCGYVELGVREKLGYDVALKRWRNVVLMERRSTAEQFR